jgi:hypothetical protein
MQENEQPVVNSEEWGKNSKTGVFIAAVGAQEAGLRVVNNAAKSFQLCFAGCEFAEEGELGYLFFAHNALRAAQH